MSTHPDFAAPRIAVLGGGPGGYEAAAVAASLGAKVTVIERNGLGGAAVLTDVVPSKTLIATADLMARVSEAHSLGVRFEVDSGAPTMVADLEHIDRRVMELAQEQSDDIRRSLEEAGVKVLIGDGVLQDDRTIKVTTKSGSVRTVDADAIILAVGAHPRELPSAKPDGERILKLDPALQPDHAARGTDRGRFRRDRRRVRLRVQRSGVQGHPDLQPRPGAPG